MRCRRDSAIHKEKYDLQWISLFSEAATSRQYANSMRKSRCAIRKPTDWSAPAVIHAEFALRLAGRCRTTLPNFVRSELIRRLISAGHGISGLLRVSNLTFLGAFRVPSEALLIQRAQMVGEADIYPPQKEKSLIAHRSIGGQLLFIAKRAWRKHTPWGSNAERHFFRPRYTDRDRSIYPARWLWP